IGALEIVALAGLVWAAYTQGSVSWGQYLRADGVTAVFLLSLGVIFALVLVYASGYFQHLPPERFSSLRWFYALLFLFLFTMVAAYESANLGLLWIFMEGTTLASALLVGFYETEGAVEAGWKYLVVCTVGLAFALFGTIALYLAAVRSGIEPDAALDWPSLLSAAPQMAAAGSLVKLGFVFLVVGYGTKLGLVPLHSWLPDAHAEAPSPISAMLSAALLNCAMYALLRFDAISTRAVGAGFSHGLLLIFGAVSIVVAGLLMIVQRDLKRLFAYSSVEHMGIIATGVGLGGTLGLYGALLHTFNHSLAKSVLFFAAGNIRENLGTLRMDRMSGVGRMLPFASGTLVLGGLAIVGFPPFALFVSEFAILSEAFLQARHVVVVAFHADARRRAQGGGRSIALSGQGRGCGGRDRTGGTVRLWAARACSRSAAVGESRRGAAAMNPKILEAMSHKHTRESLEEPLRSARLVSVFGSTDRRRLSIHYVVDTGPKGYQCFQFPVEGPVPSITAVTPAAAWYEREVHDQYGIEISGHPDLRPLMLHENWPGGIHPMRDEVHSVPWGSRSYQFLTVKGEGVCELPVGPVHAGVIEPGHFRFSVVGDRVIHLELRHFYTHKGTEKLFEGTPVTRGTLIAESVSGDNCFAHAVAYSQAIENAYDVPIPPRAAAIRLIGLELERLLAHIGDVGALCGDVGFSLPAAQAARLKENLLRISAACIGTRYWRAIANPGGLKRDLSDASAAELAAAVERASREFAALARAVLATPSVQNRFEGAGVLKTGVA